MVGAGTLQNIHKRLVEIFETDVPFAGRSVLFVGDLNQLRPVMDSPIFEAPRGRDLSLIAGPVLWQKVRFFRLEKIMRQRDDQAFPHSLNHLATGNLKDEDKELFKARLSRRHLYSSLNQQSDFFRLMKKSKGSINE